MSIELKQAAQQALECLESLQGGCTDSDDGTVEAITVWCPEVIEALRTAIQQAEAKTDEPVVEFMGRRLTPDGTRECWGILLCDSTQDPPTGTKLYQWPPTTHNWQHVIPGGRKTDQWDSTRIADYNQGWNDYRKAVKSALGKLYTSPPGKDSNEQTT